MGLAATSGTGKAKPLVLRRIVFCLMTLFIFLGPAPGQVLGKHSPWLREWIMFSGVGIGTLKGTFEVTLTDGTVNEYSPLEAAGLERYPLMLHYQFEGRVFAADDLGKFAKHLCNVFGDGHRIAFHGEVGTRQGWEPMASDDLCTIVGADE